MPHLICRHDAASQVNWNMASSRTSASPFPSLSPTQLLTPPLESARSPATATVLHQTFFSLQAGTLPISSPCPMMLMNDLSRTLMWSTDLIKKTLSGCPWPGQEQPTQHSWLFKIWHSGCLLFRKEQTRNFRRTFRKPYCKTYVQTGKMLNTGDRMEGSSNSALAPPFLAPFTDTVFYLFFIHWFPS